MTGNRREPQAGGRRRLRPAAMEPGRRDREQGITSLISAKPSFRPQWSPVDVTGNSQHILVSTVQRLGAAMEPGRRDREQHLVPRHPRHILVPQWSPVDVTGNRAQFSRPRVGSHTAAMEPGRRDREQVRCWSSRCVEDSQPQWSPVDVTGNRWNTRSILPRRRCRNGARST